MPLLLTRKWKHKEVSFPSSRTRVTGKAHVSCRLHLLDLTQAHVENPNFMSLDSHPPASTQLYLCNGALINQHNLGLNSLYMVMYERTHDLWNSVPPLPLTLELGRFYLLSVMSTASLSLRLNVCMYEKGIMEHDS